MAKLGEICTINPKGYSLSEDVEVSFVSMTKVGEHGEWKRRNSSRVKKWLWLRKYRVSCFTSTYRSNNRRMAILSDHMGYL